MQKVRLELRPSGIENVELVRYNLPRFLEETLRADGKLELLERQEMQLEFEETFPTAEVIVAVLTLLSHLAIEYWKYRLEKKLKEEYDVKITIEVPKST